MARGELLGAVLVGVLGCGNGGTPVAAPVRNVTEGSHQGSAGTPPVASDGAPSSRSGVGGSRVEPTVAAEGSSVGETAEAAGSRARPVVLDLALDGFLPLLVLQPRGEGPFPVLIATHGAGGSAEAHCEDWWTLLGGSHLVACPRGQALFRTDPGRGFFYANHHDLGEELLAAVAALQAPRLRGLGRGWIFAGYSQGATMGALALSEGHRLWPFDRLVLVEGGYDTWSAARAARVAKAGVRRVLLVCGAKSCRAGAPRAKTLLLAKVPEVRLVSAPGAGHTYLDAVREQVAQQLGWLTGP